MCEGKFLKRERSRAKRANGFHLYEVEIAIASRFLNFQLFLTEI